MLKICTSEQEWKAERLKYLTASDAANYCNCNPFDSFGLVRLWEEKTGLKARPDISSKENVLFGKSAEEHLRALFLLMHPEFYSEYYQFGLYISEERPYMAATLDDLLHNRETGETEILEIKTASVRNGDALRSWRQGEIPINYWCQELHQLYCVPEASGVWTFAHVRAEWIPAESWLIQVHHRRDEQDVSDDMPWLLEQADDMHRRIESRQRPATTIRL